MNKHSTRLWTCLDGRGQVVLRGIERASTIGALALGLACSERRRSMWLDSTSVVHTFGMRYALDICYLDAQGRALKVTLGLRPCRIGFGPRGARTAIETFADDPSAFANLEVGDIVRIEPEEK